MTPVFKLTEGSRPWGPGNSRDSRRLLIDTVDATGGLVAHPDGTFGCEGDLDWCDLADAYIEACQELGVAPLVRGVTNEEGSYVAGFTDDPKFIEQKYREIHPTQMERDQVCIFNYPHFGTPDGFPEYSARRGARVTIIRALAPHESGEDEGGERMYEVTDGSGWVGQAFASELQPVEGDAQ